MKERALEDFGLVDAAPTGIPVLFPLTERLFDKHLRRTSPEERAWLNENFTPKYQEHAYKYSRSGRLARAYVYISDDYVDGEHVNKLYDDRFLLSEWAKNLSHGTYRLADQLSLTKKQKQNLYFGWAAGAYTFDKYRSHREPQKAFIKIDKDIDVASLLCELNATYLVQDLINEPANKLNCEQLTQEASGIAQFFGAAVRVIKGGALIDENFPLIYAVGRASEEEPRLIDIQWGSTTNKSVTIVGKGVVFDSGGANTKSEDQMRDMKYDMAGAAHALGLAYMIMKRELPVRLRVLLPIVENIAGPKNYKQGDILKTRKGESITITHTDAEGRLILADALHEAAHPADQSIRQPDLIIGFGTTGWHGYFEYPGWGSLYANRKHIQDHFSVCARECQEYFARRPTLKPLRRELQAGYAGTDLLQAVEHHARYDDLNVFNLLHMQIEPRPQTKSREPNFVYMDISPFRESNTTATQYPSGLPSGGFAMGVRTSFKFIERHLG